MRKLLSILTVSALIGALLAGCVGNQSQASSGKAVGDETQIVLSDSGVTVDGQSVSSGAAGVTTDKGILYYHNGTNASYGAGDDADMHTEADAAAHTVVTITQPGTYRVTGTLSAGQIAVDLGEKARTDASAVVNLILDQASITCTVAPAIIVYNAYECGSTNLGSASAQQDTSAAGFNLLLADGTESNVSGSYVAKIYQSGTTQALYQYDAAIESAVSWNLSGDTGILNVTAQNEGLESALHLTMNGGVVNITSGGGAVNADEDGLSVFTMNGGTLNCTASAGDEGSGIVSNGWIVLNGGTVKAAANPESQDSGIAAGSGILLNGGTLTAIGNAYDEISTDSAQQYMVLSLAEKAPADAIYLLCSSAGDPVLAFAPGAAGTDLVISAPQLTDGDYLLYMVSAVKGTAENGVYTDITGYEGAVQLGYTGAAAGGTTGQTPSGETPGTAPSGSDSQSQTSPTQSPGAAGAPQTESSAQVGEEAVQTTFNLSAQSHRFFGVRAAKQR